VLTEAGDVVVANLEAGVTSTDERPFRVVTQLTTSAIVKLTLVNVCNERTRCRSRSHRPLCGRS